MKIPIVFALVVLLWGSTPLGIRLSNESFSFTAAVMLRMGIALPLAMAVLWWQGKPLVQDRSDWKVYGAAAMGIFPALPLVYWAAQYISSGLISVLFGLTPFITGLMTLLILRTNPFDWQKVLGLILALLGLVIIFQGQLQFGPSAIKGIVAVLMSSTIFALSSVCLQRFASNIEPMRQTAGALLLSFPALFLVWLFTDGTLAQDISWRSGGAVVYLAVCGSLLGFPAYFYLLKHMSAATISLNTLMTPAVALMLGALILDESLEASLLIGAGTILLSLAFYQGLLGRLLRKLMSPMLSTK
ncbi:EamA family transporter [Pseudoteredinibacter isoporae]|uniref:Drug/metabolite transporter (DMT)-like permease n=1 Tax=Pseudoteredinibacter isoporae TaxID=570281 RepID=A0A7X0MVI9_9GAMM|nr:drug/metabolite transporter (DMT)-like permease [Pseudoteredinibacter isoporae]NHO86720.1 DMT family transporter [Pseudoteredinibacter isoporae]NIB24828.1 DMT family transporter [Pseudoteredinibacter isoporae]